MGLTKKEAPEIRENFIGARRIPSTHTRKDCRLHRNIVRMFSEIDDSR